MSSYEPKDQIIIPPPDAQVRTTACDYCIVACGYKVYTWPEGQAGGERSQQNALGADYPTPALSGRWVSPNQQSRCLVDGKSHHVTVVADGDATVVNRGGNHSIRGGCLAQKVYHPDAPTKDRLSTPLLRVKGKLTPVSWDTAISIMAAVSKHVIEKHGVSSWAMKTFSYQYFENTYAISKLAFESIQTPAYSPHDKPGPGADTAGIDDSGIIPFSACYEDYALADRIMISGTDPFETKTIIFTEWMMKGNPNKRIVMVLPRKSTGAAWAEKNGGLFLQILPGTDPVLHMAMARLIIERGWEDSEFIEQHIANRWEIDSGFGRGTRNTPWQWRTTWGKLGATWEQYRGWLLKEPVAELKTASRITGIPAKQIEAAAELVARPDGGKRPKTCFVFEKGLYWSNNYLGTASYAALGLVCGSGSRPGRMISRMGGHQRGWMGAAPYPRILSPQKHPGRRRQEIDLDRWVRAGNVRWAWVIGTTWCQAMAASASLMDYFHTATCGSPHQIKEATAEAAIETLKRRADDGGMVVVHQDIYMVTPMASTFADLVLPAATWGECDFTRCNGERRLRLYSKFCDAPGQAKPDWWIISRFAQRMGYKDYDWQTSNQVFEEAARFGRKGVLSYHALVSQARKQKRPAHDLLRDLGTTGIQTPIRLVAGKLVGTQRLHDETLKLGPPQGPTMHPKWLTHFNTHSGKAILHKTPWSLFSDFYERISPRAHKGELWITNGRVGEIWQSAFDDKRRPFIMRRWPATFVEINPDDAAKRGIENGDLVRMTNDEVLSQTSGFLGVEATDLSFTKLWNDGHIKVTSASCEAVAMLTEGIRPGVLFTNFLDEGSPINALVHAVPDPITNRYRFKLARGRVEKIGESPYKKSLERMSFKPRTVV